MGWLRRLIGGAGRGGPDLDLDELLRRLDVTASEVRGFVPQYREISIPRKRAGLRKILVPDGDTKWLQRRIHRRLLRLLVAHPAATGFELGQSIATNARQHVGKAVVVRMDIRDFFMSTGEQRVQDFFRRIGWSRDVADLLMNLTTYRGGLPPGAPTSPRLSNLVNYGLDARLSALALKLGATYTRYADDITYSFDVDDRSRIGNAIQNTDWALEDHGYTMHRTKKLCIRRRHQRQVVTGLVVNERANLPRKTRRRLRAIQHHLDHGRRATLTRSQLEGWNALEQMIAND